MTGLFDALIDGAGNFIGALLVAPVAAAVEAGRRLRKHIKTNKDRSTENADRLDSVEQTVRQHDERLDRTEDVLETHALRLTGDDDDPTNPGALQSINNLAAQVDHLEEKVEENHSEVTESLDRITDSLSEGQEAD
ncbi:hypothetical protein [Halostella sp. PRR32]|uniref:hypothetical protein n=1 Tax=Halostella sp. PRR32 TaxID=3098147 RepID=UPI002B1E0D09|nr:hypothetical protein [Halostella sp. PRR32]